MKDEVAQMTKAFREGAQTLRGTLGIQTDPELAAYTKLTPDMFNDMAKQYGPNAVIDYIKDMEQRGMGLGVKKHAKS